MTQPTVYGESQGDHVGHAGSTVFFSNPLMSDTESDWSPIHDAAYNGRLLSLRNIIGQGTSVNVATLDRVSPLHGACQQGHTACVKILIEHGANVNLPTVNWSTPLSEACGRGDAACVNLLLQHGADPQGAGGNASPIHHVAARGHTECIEPLLQHGADINQWTDHAGSPLYAACDNERPHTVKKLLQLGANVNSGKDGHSPLHAAARLSNAELVRTLLDHGADCSSRDTEGKRPVDLAPPNSAVEKLLTQRGGVSRLMQLCRLSIRTILGRERLKEIHVLPIPTELKQYLLYQLELWVTFTD